jgi:ferric enterobactin receptor
MLRTLSGTAAAAAALLLCAQAAAAQVQGPPPGARPGGPGAGAPGQPPASGPGIIRGTVVDAATGRGVASAQVAVRSAADSSLVTGAVARSDGTFRIEGLRPGRYILRVTALSYTAGRTAPLAVTAAAPQADAGTIRLAAGGIALQGITATAERSEVSMAPDRNVYQARNIAATGGTAVDVLRNVPSVEVDSDGNVSLRGNSAVAIQINGRAAPLQGAQLARFLQQLPSNLVDKVEVVPNPSAKNDPEGMGGIINIVLKQGADLGTSGGFALGAATGDKYNASGNLGWQQGKVTLFGTYGFNVDHRVMSGTSTQLNRAASTSLLQDLDGRQSMHGHNATGNAEYKFGPATSLATNLMFSRRAADRLQDNLFHQLDAGSTRTGQFREVNDGDMHGQTYDASLSLKHAFTPQRNDLSAEARFTRDRDQAIDRFTHDELDATFQPAGDEPGLTRNTQHMGSRTLTGQLDWTRALAARTKLETGYKGTARRIDNDYRAELFSYGSDGWEDRVGQSNAFRYDENVNAVYAVLTHAVGKVDLQAGLRAEHAGTNFDLGASGGDAYDNSYESLFPSALVAYNLTPSRQVKASYSRRVQRPDTRMLNPFLFYQDPQHAWQGNPYLKPEYTDAFELGFQQSGRLGSLQVTPFYRHSTNAIRPIQTIDALGFTTTTAQNLATADHYGADVNGSLRLGTKLQAFGGFSAFKMVVDANNVGTGLATNTLTWSARGNATWKVDPRTDVQVFAMYRAPMRAVTGRFGAFSMSNLSIRRKLDADHSTLSLRLSDPFDQMGFRLTTSSDTFWQETRNKFGARAAYVTFNYNFGHAPRIRAPRPDGNGGADPDPRTGPGGPG